MKKRETIMIKIFKKKTKINALSNQKIINKIKNNVKKIENKLTICQFSNNNIKLLTKFAKTKTRLKLNKLFFQK